MAGAAPRRCSFSHSLAFLVVLEELSALERAAFLLHDVFGYGYGELSTAVSRDQAACRQLVARARKHVAARGRRFEADQSRAQELTKQFLAACSGGDLKALLAVLADDVVVWTDGGGKAKAAPKPVMGAAKAARFLIAITGATPAGHRGDRGGPQWPARVAGPLPGQRGLGRRARHRRGPGQRCEGDRQPRQAQRRERGVSRTPRPKTRRGTGGQSEQGRR